jgi:hypothetical protein
MPRSVHRVASGDHLFVFCDDIANLPFSFFVRLAGVGVILAGLSCILTFTDEPIPPAAASDIR